MRRVLGIAVLLTLFWSHDPAGSFLFAVVQAEAIINPTTSMPWRSNGMAPQPLVQFDTANRTNVVTPTLSSTNPPGWLAVWREGFFYKAKDLLSTGVKLQVFDSNGHHAADAHADEQPAQHHADPKRLGCRLGRVRRLGRSKKDPAGARASVGSVCARRAHSSAECSYDSDSIFSIGRSAARRSTLSGIVSCGVRSRSAR